MSIWVHNSKYSICKRIIIYRYKCINVIRRYILHTYIKCKNIKNTRNNILKLNIYTRLIKIIKLNWEKEENLKHVN